MTKFFTKLCRSNCLIKLAALLTFITLLALVVMTYRYPGISAERPQESPQLLTRVIKAR